MTSNPVVDPENGTINYTADFDKVEQLSNSIIMEVEEEAPHEVAMAMALALGRILRGGEMAEMDAEIKFVQQILDWGTQYWSPDEKQQILH